MDKDNHLIWEAFQNKLPGAGPDAALRNTGAGENEEYDAEDTHYASGQVGGRGEEYGSGEVKLLLLRDEKFDCYLNGTVQSVAFFRGTIFNCEPFDGEFYNCESDEYGTIAITPDAHLKILDAPAGSTNTEDEDAEGVSAAFHYDPMPGLEKTANQIRDLLQGAANDEARTEHIIKMAQTILGDPTEYDKNEYRKMLDGLIVLLNRFIIVPMN